MPVRRSDLNRPLTCHLPQAGEVEIRDVSWKSLGDLLGTIGDTEEESERARFVDKLLAQMIVDPATDASEIAQLHSSDLVALVDCAATVMNASEDLAEIHSELPSRERLYQAIENHHKKLNQQFLESFRKSSTMWSVKPITFTEGAMQGSSIFGQTMSNWTGAIDLLSQAKQSLTAAAMPPNQLPANSGLQTMSEALAASKMPPDLLSAGSGLQTAGEALAAAGMSADYLRDISSSIAALNLAEPYLSDSLRISGWDTPFIHTTSYEIPEVGPYESEEEVADRAEQAERDRRNSAYDALAQLEGLLRKFVGDELRRHVGNRWWKDRIPDCIQKGVSRRKKNRETSDSLQHDEVHYLYLSDVKKIIRRQDNWDECFGTAFVGQDTVFDAMFLWVEPVRNDIAHIRPVSDDEYAQFMMATNWFTRYINRVSG